MQTINRTKLTIHDIARAAGVSTGTVSRALNDRAGVNQQTRERVLEVVQNLGYVPDVGARQLAKGARTIIGVTRYSDTSLRNPYYTLLVDVVQQSLVGSGYSVHILSSDTELEHARFAGVIVPGVRLEDSRLAHLRLQRSRTPFVAIGVGAEQPDIASVELNNRSGTLEVMRHLIARGHRRITHVTGAPIGRDAQQRLDAYSEILNEANLSHHEVLDGGFTELGAYRAVTRALHQGSLFTALMCASDEMALGAIQAIKDAGKRVPEDIAVTGFDDLPLESFQAAQLTTVHQPLREIGHLAAQLLLEQLEGIKPRTVTFTPKLVVRHTA
jgi:LacI family transcriptional regulator